VKSTLGQWRARGLCLIAAAALSGCASTMKTEPPKVDSAASTQALKLLPRKPGTQTVVAIYEFRSNMGEVAARATTDMFITALVQSGQFRVVERSRLNEGVIREKQLNAQGLSSGKSASQQLLSARYVFEGVISEANAGELQRNSTVRIGATEIGSSRNRDVIAVDVRVVDSTTGEILGVVTVRKSVLSDARGVASSGGFFSFVNPANWRAVPEVQLQQQRRESLDAALRAAIDQAVIELASRFPQEGLPVGASVPASNPNRS
jgi:curli biogenesis system outer membrane secretion channel CsgG